VTRSRTSSTSSGAVSIRLAPPPLVRRAVGEVRRALAPRVVTGRIEAAFALPPEAATLLFAVAAPLLDESLGPLRTHEAWASLLAGSSLDPDVGIDMLVHAGLVRETPELVPHPSLIARLLGAGALAPPSRLSFAELTPRGARLGDDERAATALAICGGLGCVRGGTGGERQRIAARIAADLGWRALLAQPRLGVDLATLRDAAREVRLHGAVLVLDLEAWRAVDVDLVSPEAIALLGVIAPVVVLAAADEPSLAPLRAFSIQADAEQVSSPP